MNIVSYGHDNYIISLGNTPVLVDNVLYKNTSMIVRLLNHKEINRLQRISDKSALSMQVMYDDIVSACYIGMVGIPENSNVDLDNSGAGLVEKVAQAILSKSIELHNSAVESIRAMMDSTSQQEVIAAVVSRFTSTPYDDVIKYPINKLYKHYAICATTFPDKVQTPEPS